ncbi:kelch-like protein 21 isoform X2 [Paramacrobiotus metropolitanus]|uniref:kelch-like protein 21 isoform X2 n=1 Tax=Paramacrobiotus metropolitanus TaxID=2943436 RepID=UPI00244635C5|nr:kelch-like protein 21 isoform X2 [Paramacrobiotus metropolitanus]
MIFLHWEMAAKPAICRSEQPSHSFLPPTQNVLYISSDVAIRGADDQNHQTNPVQWISCRRAILAARSSYFRSMFTSQMKEAHEKQIYLKNIPHKILHQIIQYTYYGKISLDADNVLLLLESALFLGVLELVNACKEFLKRNMNARNWLTVQQAAEFLSWSDVVQLCEEFVVKNFSTVSRCDDFLKISDSKMMEFVASDDLFVKCEDEVADAVIRWLNSDPDQRMRNVGEFLPLVRAPFLSAERSKLIRGIYIDPEKVPIEQFRMITDGIIQHTPYKHRKSYRGSIAQNVPELPEVFVGCHEAYNPRTNQWLRKFANNWDIESGSARLFTFDGKLHLVPGGCGAMKYYDAIRDRWIEVARQTPQLGAGCAGQFAREERGSGAWRCSLVEQRSK